MTLRELNDLYCTIAKLGADLERSLATQRVIRRDVNQMSADVLGHAHRIHQTDARLTDLCRRLARHTTATHPHQPTAR